MANAGPILLVLLAIGGGLALLSQAKAAPPKPPEEPEEPMIRIEITSIG